MNPNNETITNKIKHLLRLAACKAATPAEAALALARAQELMARHHIDIASLDLDESTEAIIEERINLGARVSHAKRLIANILLTYFSVKTVFVNKKDPVARFFGKAGLEIELVIMGFESDVAMAGYVFHFLVGASSRAVSKFAAEEKAARRKVTASKKANFIEGWMYGLANKLRSPDATSEALSDSQTALVLSKRKTRLDERFEAAFPSSTLKPAKEHDHRENWRIISKGFAEGKNTSIAQPLAGSQQGTLLLT